MGVSWSSRGYVYFAIHSRRDVVKVGFSRNPMSRIEGMQFQREPGKFRLLGFVWAVARLEQRLHKKFSPHRVKAPESREFYRYSAIAGEIERILLRRKVAATKTLSHMRNNATVVRMALRRFGGYHPLAAFLGVEPKWLAGQCALWAERDLRHTQRIRKECGHGELCWMARQSYKLPEFVEAR